MDANRSQVLPFSNVDVVTSTDIQRFVYTYLFAELSVFIFILAHLTPEEYVLHVFLFFSFLPSSLSSL